MTAKPRLAIVVSHPIQHFVHLYRALAARGDVEVKVLFCSKIGLKSYFDKEMNTTIAWAGDMVAGYSHEFLPESDSIDTGGFFAINNPSVGAALARFKPDAVMLYGYAQVTQLRALAWCRFKGVPVLMTGDGDNVQQRSRLRGLVRNLVLKRLMRQVAGFLTVGDQNENMLSNLGIERLRMFRAPFPIDEAVYLDHRQRRALERSRIRRQHGIADDAFVMVFVGKISARKRPQDLVAAWARLKSDEGRSAKLVLLFCGDGPDRKGLEQAIAAANAPAVLAGFVNVDQLPAYYCAADILVHPSEHDPHPLVCSEAACIGLPMILSDRVGAVGPSDVARQGQNALVYSCGDADALAAAMAKLLDDGALCRSMSEASLRIYGECGLEASAAGVVRGLQSVTGGKQNNGTAQC